LKLVVFNKIFHFDKLKVIDEELVAEELSAIPDATVDRSGTTDTSPSSLSPCRAHPLTSERRN